MLHLTPHPELAAYQAALDRTLEVGREERAAVQRGLLPPNIAARLRRRARLRGILGGGGCLGFTVLLVLALVTLYALGRTSLLAVLEISLLIGFITLLIAGVFIVTSLRDLRALDAPMLRTEDGVSARQVMRGGKGPPRYVVRVGEGPWRTVPQAVHDALAEGRPHRLHVLLGADAVVLIDALG